MFNLKRTRKLSFLATTHLLIITSFNIVEGAAKTWVGTTNDWSTGSNWSPSGAPTNADDATIPTSPTGGNFPTISTGTVAVKKMTIQSGATVTQTGGTLQVADDWENSGTFTASSGAVQFTGNGSAASIFNVGTNQFYDVIVDAGIDPKFDNNANGSILVSHDFTNNNTGLDNNVNPTFTFNGSGNQNIFSAGTSGKTTFGNLVINKSGGTVSLTSGLEVFSDLTITAGSLSTGSNYTLLIGGNAAFNGGSFTINASTIIVPGTWTNAGSTITGGACSLDVAGDFTLTTGSISASTGTLLLGGNFTNNSSNATFDIPLTLNGATKTIGGSSSTTFTNVHIGDNASYTMNTDNTMSGLTFDLSANNSSLSLASGKTLTVNGNITITQPSASKVVALNVNAGAVTVTGNVNIGGSNTSTGRIARIVTTTGTLVIGGNLVFNSAASTSVTAVIDMSGGAGTTRLAGNLTMTNGTGTLTPGATSTFEYNGSGAQSIADGSSISYNTLKVNKSSGTLSLTSNLTIGGDLQVDAGTFSTSSSNYTISAIDLTLNGGSINFNSSDITISGNIVNNGTSISGGNSIIFTGASKSISGTYTSTFPAVIITTGTLTLDNSVTCTSLTFANNNVANSVTISSGKTLTVNGNVTINQASGNGVVHALNVNSGTATINGDVTFNVTANNAGRIARIVTTTGTLNITGNITMTNAFAAANSVIDMSGGAGTMNLSGNITVTTLGTLTPGTTSTVNFNGTSAQSISFTSLIRFNNINSNNSHASGVTIAAAITSALVTGDVRIQSGIFNNGGFGVAGAAAKTFAVSNGAAFNLSGTTGMVTGFGTKTFGATSTVNYTGTAQTVSAETYGHLILSTSGVKTMPGSAIAVAGNFSMTGTASATAAQVLTVDGNFSIGNGTTFSASTFSHGVKGNWTNDGTFNGNTSTFTLNGTSAQSIGGGNSTTFSTLVISNSNNITLNKGTNVSTLLTMSTGKILTTTSNILTLQSSANANIGSSTSYVDGPMIQTVAAASGSRTFPIGKASAYRPLVISVNHSNATSVTYQAEVNNSSAAALGNALPGGIEKVSPTRYTSIARQAVANFTNATVQIYYGADDGVSDFTNLRLVNNDGAGNWVNIGGTGSANTTGNITSASFSPFNSSFALANATGGFNPLPVKLTDLKAEPIDKTVKISWATFSENNNDYFDVERAGENLIYSKLSSKRGAGNSNIYIPYQAMDFSPLAGISYYRLKQVDLNGAEEYFGPVKVQFNKTNSFQLFPTVSDGSNIHLSYIGEDLKAYEIIINNIEGKSIPFVALPTSIGMDISIDSQYRNQNGLFFVTCTNGDEVFREKFIVSE